MTDDQARTALPRIRPNRQKLIIGDLMKKGELTTDDVCNRLRSNHGIELTREDTSKTLRDMALKKILSVSPMGRGSEKASIWRLAE